MLNKSYNLLFEELKNNNIVYGDKDLLDEYLNFKIHKDKNSIFFEKVKKSNIKIKQFYSHK